MVTDTISSGISYLETQQQNDGSFLSLSSQSPTNFKNAITLRSTFSTALILSCLNYLEETPTLHKIKEKAASFLLTQKSKHWSFNYWVRGSKEARVMPYPDDLDDTFCALSALYQYDPKLIDGAVMAKVVELLTMLEEKEGGPYRTWLVPESADKKWKDIDLAVNSNIAYLLSLHEIELPNLTRFVEAASDKNSLTSPYYYSMFSIIYFISRFYCGKLKDKLIKKLLLLQNGKGLWDNPLHSALAMSSLINFTIKSKNIFDKTVQYLLTSQVQGKWKPYPLIIELVKKDKTNYSGSSALTTAFCLEAIGKYRMALTKQSMQITKKIDLKSKYMRDQIVLRVQKRFSHLSHELKDQAENMLKVILKMDDKNQITLLPYFFKKALGKNGALLSNKILISLGAANTYGWMAYTIYDNFLDEEGDPKTLSIANIALRELTIIFHEVLPESVEFQKLFHKVMDELDGANAWEVTHCRMRIVNETIDLENTIPQFGNNEKLAQKSLGHSLGPLAILFLLGYGESLEIKNLLIFFRHYLIARQLNDDAHDWEKDFKNGHINPVCAMLIRKFKMKNKKSERKFLFSKLIPKFQELFWHEVIVNVCELILRHVALGRRSLSHISIMENQVFFRELLNSIERSAKQVLEERKKTLAFIKSY